MNQGPAEKSTPTTMKWAGRVIDLWEKGLQKTGSVEIGDPEEKGKTPGMAY